MNFSTNGESIADNKKYTVAELRPSAVIMAAKFIKAGKSPYVAAGHVSLYMELNGHKTERGSLSVQLVVNEAFENPLK